MAVTGGPLHAEILIVAPEATGRAALVELLSPLTRLAEAASGEEALRLAREREFAAILVDMRLPDGDGFWMVTELRRGGASHNVPVLFLTDTVPDWLTERRGLVLGALGYVTKPIDAPALRSKVEILVALSRRGIELRQTRDKNLDLGVLGHDLRSPLSAIMLSSRMLLMRPSLTDGDRQTVARIARTADRMATLIRDILDYTRGQTPEGLPIVPRPADMGEICSAMVEEMSLLHMDRRIELRTRGDLQGEWDRGRVEQVLSNLLVNAINHGEGAITLSADANEEEVIVRVHNGGPPIPRDLMPTLFEPFRRGSNSRIGLGLGLYIVREIMRGHGGGVDVASHEGDGTTFTTRWPRRANLRDSFTYDVKEDAS